MPAGDSGVSQENRSNAMPRQTGNEFPSPVSSPERESRPQETGSSFTQVETRRELTPAEKQSDTE
jgi:hypothetical protein